MPWRSRHHFPSLKIAIVGGGVASLVAGITLREKLPNAEITLYTAVGEAMLGANWRVGMNRGIR
jgi:predicted NAD/FAD-binding protein